MENCIFCQISEGKIKSHILYKDDISMALLDIFPSIEGHAMVIPRKHGRSILDFSASELGHLWETVKRMEKALIKTYNTESFSVGINQGEKAGVEHLHIHIIPRFPGDNGRIIQDLVKKDSKTVLSKVIKKITKNIE